MLVSFVSAKGAPGVTTAALALSAAAGGVLVEFDPSGGSVECWTGVADEPGLLRAASSIRRGLDTAAWLSFLSEPVPGCRALLAPTAGSLAEATVSVLADRLVPACADVDDLVVFDGGRWAPSQPSAGRVSGCDVVGVVCQPTIESVEAARWLLEALRSIVHRVELVLVGDRPYQSTEVAAAIGEDSVGVLAWDRRGLAALLHSGARRAWVRSPLARSAGSLRNRFTNLDGEGPSLEPTGLNRA